MSEDILNLDPEKARGNPRAASLRLEGKSQRKAVGQRRHDFRKGRQPNYVDAQRTDLNRILIAPRPLPQIRREVEEIRRLRGGKTRAMKSNAVIVTAGLLSFGTEARLFFAELTPAEQDAALLDLARSVGDRLQTSLTSLVVHLDESAFHAHFEMHGFDDNGQPISKAVNRTVSSELQDLAHEVMQRHCPQIERGHRKWDRLAAGANYADTVHRRVRQLHHDLPFEIATKQRELEVLSVRGEDLRASVAEEEARLAEKKAELQRVAQRSAEARQDAARRQASLQEREIAVSQRECEAQALAEGLPMLADGWIAYHPAADGKRERLRIGDAAPQDENSLKHIDRVAKAVGPALRIFGRLIWDAARKMVARERAKIAEDASELVAIRQEMGIGLHETLEDIRRRNDETRPRR